MVRCGQLRGERGNFSPAAASLPSERRPGPAEAELRWAAHRRAAAAAAAVCLVRTHSNRCERTT